MNHHEIIARRAELRTLGELRRAGWQSVSVRDEIRRNLRHKIQHREPLFHGIIGYENSVIPEVERALLSRHHIIFLGLRGQAKTRMARLMVNLLDEYMPVVEGSEIHDDPYRPLSRYGRDAVAAMGDSTPIAWVHRAERYVEKLATPDVTVADLIGDVDPIKAASLKLPYSDERVIHFGLIPRANRCIFVINELPDLQPRIQVSLFNILQEGDIQLRGFAMRLPLDVQFVFTANPEDYTNRGSIITPLKDRIDSQILTHYPRSAEHSLAITRQEARIPAEVAGALRIHPVAPLIIEHIAIEARKSEYVDSKSGVSARLTISAAENLASAAERRALMLGSAEHTVRMADFLAVIPSITGKVELVYEGEQEGAAKVAHILLGKAIRAVFPQFFPNPEGIKRQSQSNPYAAVLAHFARGATVELLADADEASYGALLRGVDGLEELVKKHLPQADERDALFLMDFVLHGLAEYSLLSKNIVEPGERSTGIAFGDLFRSMFDMKAPSDDDDVE